MYELKKFTVCLQTHVHHYVLENYPNSLMDITQTRLNIPIFAQAAPDYNKSKSQHTQILNKKYHPKFTQTW